MMKSKISDEDVLQYFASLKNAEKNYPQEMIDSRRDKFTKQAAAMAVLMKAGANGTSPSGAGQAASTGSGSTTTLSGGMSIGTLLETVLVIAIILEAGVAAFVYREKIAEFINSTFNPKVEQVANPPEDSSSDPIKSHEATVKPSESTSPPTITITPAETPTPLKIISPASSDANESNVSGDTENNQVIPTPAPDENPGNHFGNTPKPERTKDNGNNNQDNNKDKDKNKNK